VIQCLSPSAVTSLGSPAEQVAWPKGAPSAWTSEFHEIGARRETFRRAPRLDRVVPHRSRATRQARPAAGLAVFGKTHDSRRRNRRACGLALNWTRLWGRASIASRSPARHLPKAKIDLNMLFYEPLFLTVFPAVYALYLLATGAPARKWILLVASTLFYLWGEPVFVLVLFASTAADYALSFHLSDPAPLTTRRLALAVGIAGNLAILIVYKYADFIAENLNLVLAPFSPQRAPLLHLALPIGVSFVVFEKITYLVDTFRGTSRPAATFTDYCLFVLFFPKLLAGPILKYHEMKDQIAKPPAIEWSDFTTGFLRFARGIGRKLLIADPLGAFVNVIFAADPASLSTPYAWLGLGSFTLQIYFDFAGYSDMAIGLARMLGFTLKENFNSPYVARSMTEFWRRWHISLTTWIRDYLYKPLGGNR
jgi:alginate O-acetyltransferase complex protein AlgI